MITKIRPDSSSQPAESKKPRTIALHRHLDLNRNSIAKLLTLGFISIGLSGCSTIYFHSNSDQKGLEEAVAGTNAVKINELDAIAKHKVALKQLIEQQRAAVVREQIALRDEWVTNAIQAQTWHSDIKDAVGDQTENLIGKGGVISAKTKGGKSAALSLFIEQNRVHQQQLDATRRQVAIATANFQAKGGTLKSPCGNDGGGLIVDSMGNGDGEFSQLDSLCMGLENQSNRVVGNYASLAEQPLFVRCVSGDLPSCETREGVAFDAFSDLYKVEELIATNKKLAAAAKKQLEALEETYHCAVEQDNFPDAEDRIRAAAQRIRNFVDALPDTGTKLQAKLEENPVPAQAKTVSDCPGGSTPEVKFSDLLKNVGTNPGAFQKLLVGLDKLGLASGESVAAALSDAKSSFEENRLADLVKEVAKQKNPSPVAEPTKEEAAATDIKIRVAAGVIDSIGPLHRIAAVNSGELPDTRAILVDLAMARYRQSLAKIEADRLNNSRELLQIRADAVLNQLTLLDKAMGAADHEHREEAIVYLAQSWSAGAVPASAAHVELMGYQYTNATDLDEAAVVARYATLEPLLAELQAYGAGGFTAEDIARFLSAAALAGIAVGAN